MVARNEAVKEKRPAKRVQRSLIIDRLARKVTKNLSEKYGV